MTFTPSIWKDYEVIDVGDGEKLERYGTFILRRPDSNGLSYVCDFSAPWWQKSDATFKQGLRQGEWIFTHPLPNAWTIAYNDLNFKIAPTIFKHTGLFPEQAPHWDWMRHQIKNANHPIKVLNLFAYTGAASMACAKEGASIVHVDASKGMVLWAKENAQLSGLSEAPIRYIVDDVIKFVQREIRRDNHYDAIIMDPPTFGRGPKGELWKFYEQLSSLIDACKQLLSDHPLFFLVSTYSAAFDLEDLKHLMQEKFPIELGTFECAELNLPITHKKIPLACGISARMTFK